MKPVRKSLAAALLAATLVPGAAVRAQGAPFPIPIGPEVVIGPLLVLIGAAVLLRPDDQRRLKQIEDSGRWGDAERIATRRIAELGSRSAAATRREELAQWLAVRAQARRQRRDWSGAAEDLGRSAALSGRLAPGALLEQANCLAVLGRWADAERALQGLVERDPGAAAPWRHLAVFRTLAGDQAAADRALAELRERDPDQALAVERDWVAPDREARTTAPLRGARVADPDIALADPPAVLATDRIALGGHVIALPPARWLLAAVEPRTVRGRRAGGTSVEPDREVASLEGTALAVRGQRLRAAVTLLANRRSDSGVTNWLVDPCGSKDALLVDRFAGRFDTPECLQLRRIQAEGPGAPHPALALAAGFGLSAAPSHVEVRYEAYGVDRFVVLTVLLPAVDESGGQLDDARATSWARALAPAVRALVAGRSRIADLSAPLPTGLP